MEFSLVVKEDKLLYWLGQVDLKKPTGLRDQADDESDADEIEIDLLEQRDEDSESEQELEPSTEELD
ncbi:hypothetical protein FQA39_LY06360 [Lamprigera yunnana]|nr:hypothetical protein FQA39_LY06360 [Lamprigera yunnana]